MIVIAFARTCDQLQSLTNSIERITRPLGFKLHSRGFCRSSETRLLYRGLGGLIRV